jgi:hypothetical protein
MGAVIKSWRPLETIEAFKEPSIVNSEETIEAVMKLWRL